MSPTEELGRPCTPRKRLIAARQEDREAEAGLRIATVSVPPLQLVIDTAQRNATNASSPTSPVRNFSADYVNRVLHNAVQTTSPVRRVCADYVNNVLHSAVQPLPPR